MLPSQNKFKLSPAIEGSVSNGYEWPGTLNNNSPLIGSRLRDHSFSYRWYWLWHFLLAPDSSYETYTLSCRMSHRKTAGIGSIIWTLKCHALLENTVGVFNPKWIWKHQQRSEEIHKNTQTLAKRLRNPVYSSLPLLLKSSKFRWGLSP